jgi:hypothetical protein
MRYEIEVGENKQKRETEETTKMLFGVDLPCPKYYAIAINKITKKVAFVFPGETAEEARASVEKEIKIETDRILLTYGLLEKAADSASRNKDQKDSGEFSKILNALEYYYRENDDVLSDLIGPDLA